MKKNTSLAMLCLGLLFLFVGGLKAYNQYQATRFGDVRVKDLMLDDSDIVDSSLVTRITIGANNAITGNLTVSGTTYATVALSSAPRDSSASIGLTPIGVGQLAFNTTDKELCLSTATNRFAWIEVSTQSVSPCKH